MKRHEPLRISFSRTTAITTVPQSSSNRTKKLVVLYRSCLEEKNTEILRVDES